MKFPCVVLTLLCFISFITSRNIVPSSKFERFGFEIYNKAILKAGSNQNTEAKTLYQVIVYLFIVVLCSIILRTPLLICFFELIKEAIRFNPDFSEAYNNLGLIYNRLNDPWNSIRTFYKGYLSADNDKGSERQNKAAILSNILTEILGTEFLTKY